MPVESPTLFADDRGVWREDTPGRVSGIAWEEIYRVHGYKLDGITELYTVVVLDFEFGESIELNAAWPGFREVTGAMATRLPGMSPECLADMERLNSEEVLTVWCRDGLG